MNEQPPTEAPHLTGKVHAPSLVIVNTGDGKGKSTAAFGTLLRAVARGWKIAVIQFIKSGEWKVGEEKVARSLGIDWCAAGDGFTWDSEDMDETQAVALEAWEAARGKLSSGEYDMVLLDEITYPLTWGWIDVDAFVEEIEKRPPHVNVVITGRDAPARLIEIADTVTEMVKVKHAFDEGIVARRGIDF